MHGFLQYLGKYAFMKRATSSTANKRLPCAYLNTQGSSTSGTPLKRIDNGKFFGIIMRYSLKLQSIVQYFVVLGKSNFLHFRSISNKLKKVVLIRVEIFPLTYLI
ncbi:hypothetical protein T12_4555 [Trichinella patagoniensis]|uniref:Uncharacterized protein n=1 Tax=Trichinella patagoniensis TaxID=990121 RepID=A0A0V1A347_9BILA|nr:hypothetical protein T12_4555 [Trichinella patagoniensis]